MCICMNRTKRPKVIAAESGSRQKMYDGDETLVKKDKGWGQSVKSAVAGLSECC